MKNDYIIAGNEVYSNLKEYETVLAREAHILDYVKCVLLREETLEDFYTYGTYVFVYEVTNGYTLYFDDYRLDIEVYEKQIVSTNLERS